MQLPFLVLSLAAVLASTSALLHERSEKLVARTTKALTWDKYSWMINGERVLVHSGEVSLTFLLNS